MPYSLWDRAQGKTMWDYLSSNRLMRCNLCGRRLELNDCNYVSIFIGKTATEVIIHDICSQHGGKHVDCLKGIEVNFGDAKGWIAIWMSNLLYELTFWLKSIVRFVWLILTHLSPTGTVQKSTNPTSVIGKVLWK